jgi:hypothetical protein
MIHIPYLAHIPFVILFLGFTLFFVVTRVIAAMASRRR